MILVKPSYEILGLYSDFATKNDPLHLIELAGRTCYKSEDRMDHNSASKFVKMITKLGHNSVIEHSAMTVKFIVDRGVTHELVRHRLIAFSQESTRYCNYKGGVTFVIPPWVDVEPGEYKYTDPLPERNSDTVWWQSMLSAEDDYMELLKKGWTPQQARSVLPNSLKTEIVCTTNLREWLHIFSLRCSTKAHPQMQEVMKPLLYNMVTRIPEIFGDLYDSFRTEI